MLVSIVAGLILACITIAIHALGTTAWIGWLRSSARQSKKRTDSTTARRLKVLCSTAVVLLSLHIIEVVVWALAYILVVGGKQFQGFEDSVYFSTVTFASLGYGDVVISGPRRLLSAIQSMVGLLVFGWSSALLFAVVQRFLMNEDEHNREQAS